MKKLTALSLLIATIALSFVGCSNTTSTTTTTQKTKTTARHNDSTGGSTGSGDASTRGARGPM